MRGVSAGAFAVALGAALVLAGSLWLVWYRVPLSGLPGAAELDGWQASAFTDLALVCALVAAGGAILALVGRLSVAAAVGAIRAAGIAAAGIALVRLVSRPEAFGAVASAGPGPWVALAAAGLLLAASVVAERAGR